MSLVDKNSLRAATWEMFYSEGEIPPCVAINEAIEVVVSAGNTDLNGLCEWDFA